MLLPTHVRPLLARGAPAGELDEAGRTVVTDVLGRVLPPPVASWLLGRCNGGLAPLQRWASSWDGCCRQLSEVPGWVQHDGWAQELRTQQVFTLYGRLYLGSIEDLAALVAAIDAHLASKGGADHAPYQAALQRPREVLRNPPPPGERVCLAYLCVHRGDPRSARISRHDQIESGAALDNSAVMRAMRWASAATHWRPGSAVSCSWFKHAKSTDRHAEMVAIAVTPGELEAAAPPVVDSQRFPTSADLFGKLRATLAEPAAPGPGVLEADRAAVRAVLRAAAKRVQSYTFAAGF